VSAAHPLPSLSLHRPRNKQINIKNKMPYKKEPLQAAVDFQSLADQFGSSIANLGTVLRRMRKKEEVWRAVQRHYQVQYLHPRELSSAEALQKPQQLLLAALRTS
jgi:hypothetical protein